MGADDAAVRAVDNHEIRRPARRLRELIACEKLRARAIGLYLIRLYRRIISCHDRAVDGG